MELYPSRDGKPLTVPADSIAAYLARLPLTAERRNALLEACGTARNRGMDPMRELHRLLAGKSAEGEHPAYASVRERLNLAFSSETGRAPPIGEDVRGRVRLLSPPPLHRTPMAPEVWDGNAVVRLFGGIRNRLVRRGGALASVYAKPAGLNRRRGPRTEWQRVGSMRRIMLLALVLAQTWAATAFMAVVLPYQGRRPLEIAILALFAILFCWVSAGFWTAIAGFAVLLRDGDRFAVSRSAPQGAPIDKAARTAIVMPICNEDVARVFAGLRATYESVAETGELGQFDFFVLSDTSNPDTRVAEHESWLRLCRDTGGFGRIYYRWRQHRIKRKSGNIADFCRRWGRDYRYMVVLDADSVMSGACLTRLVALMEANPDAGIIQTAPRAAGRETLYARIQQFATRVYGPLFTAGLHFWQLGESHYWGHNAIIRVEPFMRHCALGRLAGDGALSGEILSHDFVEAALMRRAGWMVWIAYDLPGSYEEMPPNLVDELKRDRRWCQGNLMNFRLFLAKGIHPAHRAVFMTGVMAYLSAPLWFLFLVLSTALLAQHTLADPTYFVAPRQLFPEWPQWHPERAIGLFSATATLLFLPKILSVLQISMPKRGARYFGGEAALAASMAVELVFSALLAPIRMLFHTQFVCTAFIGWAIQWKSPPRGDAETGWTEALRRHGLHTLIGSLWAGGVFWLNPAFLWWLLPVVGALMLSIPISVYSSRVSLGRAARRARLFLIPEESVPPRELRWTRRYASQTPPSHGFMEAVMDPVTNAVTCATGVVRINNSPAACDERTRLVADALAVAPHAVARVRQIALLNDPIALSMLHLDAWTSRIANPAWRAAFEETPKPAPENWRMAPRTRIERATYPLGGGSSIH